MTMRQEESQLAGNGDLGDSIQPPLPMIICMNADMQTCSFGPGVNHYKAFACYDLFNGGNQSLSEYGIWTGDMLVPLPAHI